MTVRARGGVVLAGPPAAVRGCDLAERASAGLRARPALARSSGALARHGAAKARWPLTDALVGGLHGGSWSVPLNNL